MSDVGNYENMLGDMVFELNELMAEHEKSSDEVRAALMNFAGVVRRKFRAFDIEQPQLSGPVSEPDIWFVRGVK